VRCCDHDCQRAESGGRYRRILWVALGLNAAMFLPAVAVGSDSDGNFVYTITDNRITRLATKSGLPDNGRIEVTAGLSEETW
jgi:hypothetical protein